MFDNKLFVAFAFLVAASGVFWMVQSTVNQQQFSLVFPEATPGAALEIGFSQSDAAGGRENKRLSTCPAADFNVKTNLKFGSRGEDVKQLQIFLLAYYPLVGKQVISDRVTGYYGSETAGFVLRYQSENDLPLSGTVSSTTRARMYDDLRTVCTPRIASIDPQRPQRGQTVTITGSNFPIQNPVTIDIWQTDNWPWNESYSFTATSKDGATLQFKVPSTARSTGNHDDRFKVQVSTNIGSSNKSWIYVYVEEYDKNRTDVPHPTPTPPVASDKSTGFDRCTNDYRVRPSACNADAQCVWDYSASGTTDGKCVTKSSEGVAPSDIYCRNEYQVRPSRCNADAQCQWDYANNHCTSR